MSELLTQDLQAKLMFFQDEENQDSSFEIMILEIRIMDFEIKVFKMTIS